MRQPPDASPPSNARQPSSTPATAGTARLSQGVAITGLALYVVFAPHSIAGAWIGLAVAIAGWIARTLLTRRWGDMVRRTPLDLPLWFFFAWSVVAAFMSAEPRISLAKLGSVSTFVIFYITQAIITRRNAVWLAALLVASGVSGALWSVAEVARGRGVCIEALADTSPLLAVRDLRPGDCIWRVNRHRVASVPEIDDALRATPPDTPLALSVISRGEHVEWTGPLLTGEIKFAPSPSGLMSAGPTRRFRASGWTRHYETFAEALQIIAQLALGFALAFFQRRAVPPRGRDEHRRRLVVLCAFAFIVLAAGIALTAMRTTLVAFAVGALVVAWRGGAGASRKARFAVILAVTFVLSLGALAVWRTRAAGALRLQDASSQSRVQVARVALARVPMRPVFGHGMDAMHRHWREWGFPGNDMLHTHSTPLQIAFDRGLPALALWLWLLAALWLFVARAERMRRALADDVAAHGLLLGAVGAVTGFAASSLVNYNFGDAEIALLLWWLSGTVAGLINNARQ